MFTDVCIYDVVYAHQKTKMNAIWAEKITVASVYTSLIDTNHTDLEIPDKKWSQNLLNGMNKSWLLITNKMMMTKQMFIFPVSDVISQKS